MSWQHPKSIVVLIRHADQLPEALRTGKRFCRAGMKVAVLLLDARLQNSYQGNCEQLPIRLQLHGERHDSSAAELQRLGFDTASLQGMAAQIAAADLVIPF